MGQLKHTQRLDGRYPHPELVANQALYKQIYNIVRQIPFGTVATYGQVARWAGYPGYARQVGYALFRLKKDTDVPWQRVINAKGEISESPMRYGSDDLQKQILQDEGIAFTATHKIDLAVFGWEGPPGLDSRKAQTESTADCGVEEV